MPESTDVATVRLLIADTASDSAKQLLSDNQLRQFLALEGGQVKLAAAQALDTIASSEALVSKAIKTQDLSTDGPKTAEALRKHAATLRGQVKADVDESDDGFFFGVVNPVTDTCSGPELTERWH